MAASAVLNEIQNMHNSGESQSHLFQNIKDEIEKSDESFVINLSELVAKLSGERNFKSCFTYFARFPPDYPFDAERLIHLWMAEGFTSSELIGRTYLRDLLNRSIFKNVEVEFGELRSCRMQPVMHDIARFIADSENIFVDKDGRNVHDKVQRASFDLRSSIDLAIPRPLFDNAKKLESLVLFKTETQVREKMSTNDLEKLFKIFKKLCVLDLRALEIEEVPSSIEKLKYLKYLDLSKNKMKVLPRSITKLSKLETLKLVECFELKELPKDFKNLAQLKHLDVEGCTKLTCMPDKMSEMSSLQTLSAFVVSEKYPTKGLEELAKLNQLRGHLQILGLEWVRSHDENTETNYLEGKQHLERLTLNWNSNPNSVKKELHLKTLDRLKPNSSLKVLILDYYYGPSLSTWLTASDQFNNLLKLELKFCHGCNYLSKQLDKLPNLQILKLIELKNLEYITEKCENEAAFYKTLQVLTIKDCLKLESWWKTNENNRPLFTRISRPYVTVENCPLPTHMPPFPPSLFYNRS